eukprot:TRINITY_DN5788_c0_g2_i2.p1 TRINITY_DN5788_c0_g2~~TRINITY_DN5788_c0_g2_i2.p1  ORF type:complete len:181 (-),score=22.49 TRINITY_DN5788_c0_g2_i2:110-652(-)
MAKATSITPRLSVYKTNGSGRDTYISFDNAGVLQGSARMNTLLSSPKQTEKKTTLFPQLGGKMQKHYVVNYRRDGNGRDGYIKDYFDNVFGGPSERSAYHSFVHKLREYDIGYSSARYITPRAKLQTQKLYTDQQRSVRRLSPPKNVAKVPDEIVSIKRNKRALSISTKESLQKLSEDLN